jgi:hypothetical protein
VQLFHISRPQNVIENTLPLIDFLQQQRISRLGYFSIFITDANTKTPESVPAQQQVDFATIAPRRSCEDYFTPN